MALPRFVPLFLFFAFDALTQILSVMAVDTTRQLSDTINQFHADSTIVVLEPMVVRERRYTEYLPSHRSIAIDSAGGRLSDLTTILEGESGVNIQRQGGVGDFAVATIRGSTARQVQVFLDGIPLNSAEGGAVDIGKIPLTAIDNISIYKGYIPFERSGNGCGGVIDLTTDLKRDVFSAGVEAGGFGYIKVGAIASGKLGEMGHRLAVDLTDAKNDFPYFNDNHTPYNLTDDGVSRKSNNRYSGKSIAYSNSVHPVPALSLQTRLQYADYSKGIYSYMYPDSTQAVRAGGMLAGINERLLFQPSATFTGEAIVGLLYRTSSLRDPLAQWYLGGQKDFTEHSPVVQGDFFLTCRIDAMQQIKVKLVGGYDWYGHDDRMVNYALPPEASRLKSGLGVSWDLRLPDPVLRATAYITARYEYDRANHTFNTLRTRVDGVEYVDSRILADGAVAVLWQWLPEISVSSHVAVMNKNPELFQKFGTDGLQIPSPSLRPEQERSVDIGCAYQNGWVQSALSCYYAFTVDEIVFQQYLNVSIPENKFDISRIGAELDVSLTPASWFETAVNLSLTDAVIARDSNPAVVGNRRPLSPLFSINAEPAIKAEVFGTRLKLSHSLLFSSPYFVSEYNVAEVTGNLPVLGIMISVEPLQGLVVRYTLDNYLDVRNYDFPNYPRPGITHLFGLSYSRSGF